MATPPDLTAGGVPNEDPAITVNLGPTGARGWVFHVKSDTSDSRQILVTEVDAGSPADGILAVDDVILGADGTGAIPSNFSSDARKSLGLAIGDAEARSPAELKLLRWRSGNTSTVTLTLQTLGAYSATAPYSCPKSAQILQQGLAYVYSNETVGRYSFGGLTLLATDNATYRAKAQTEARALIPSQATMDEMMSDERDDTAMVTWSRTHTLLFLAEYYLETGDAQVLPALEAYAVNFAKNTSLFGTVGHIYADKWPDGSANGPMGGVYGPINTTGLFGFLGTLLAKECGITHPSIDPAIERATPFFAYYAGKGAIPYGEHEPYARQHENNGKCGVSALAFMLQPDRVAEGQFFAKMSTASATERELGHTGSYFNYLWAPLGAAAGGEEAAAAYFARISWMLDLNRRWDHGFDYDCLNGEGPNSGSEYNDFRMSTAALLTYALPHRELYITGKGHDAANDLSSADVAEAIVADDYDADPRSDSQLIADLDSWSPKVCRLAAQELGTRSIDASALSQLTALAKNTSAASRSRAAACNALGQIGDVGSAPVLAALLTDPDPYVSFMAAEAMRYLPTDASLGELDTILMAAESVARPLFPILEEDPVQFAHGRIATLLFYSGSAYGPRGIIWGSGIDGVDRNQLYPAIRAIADTPIGFSRSTLGQTYANLELTDVRALAGTIVDSITERSPSDRMFSGGVRLGGVDVLERFGIAEGVPACMLYAADEVGGRRNDPLQRLGVFAGGVHTVEPDPGAVPFLASYLSDGETAATAQTSLDAIAADTNPTPLTAFKSIVSVTADDPTVTLPNVSTTLRVDAFDYANGDSVYTWEKRSGPGTVSYSDNGTAAAATNTLTFAGTPGTYAFKVTMSDSRALTEAYGTVTVTLVAGSIDAAAPTPSPMTWSSTPSAISDTEVTMTATTASDLSGVEYFFACTSGGGHDSGWQDSPTYTDIGLAPGTAYGYTVTARDKSAEQNTTAASAAASATTTGTAPPLKVFILAGQSNMEGHGEMSPLETQGTLAYMVASNPAVFAHLGSGAGWDERGDAWIWYKRDGTDILNGDISAGYGRYDHTIGPELQFGIEMANAHGEQVLLIKTAWGGKSLYTDFRPPSSGWSVNPPVLDGDQGFYYQEMLNEVSDVLTNLPTYFPDYHAAAGFELAGFGWHQGWNDRIDADAVNEYEANMANFINDVRADLGVPGLPFVIGTTGMGGWDETNQRALDLMAAQLAMQDDATYPAFDGNVGVVDTRDFWRDPAESPSQTQNYHWNRNAETYFLIGQAMAVRLQELGAGTDTAPPTPDPAGFAVRPTGVNDVSVTMTAFAGSDLSGPVEYRFTEISGNAGGTSSGWQTHAVYVDTGLLPETVYTYTVTMRDSLGNTGSTSAPASAATGSYLDVFPPTPNPADFDAEPSASSATSISMSAVIGSDESGPVEYLFTEITGNPGGTSSGWQTSASYTDTGLTPGTVYTYSVSLRDAVGNVGGASAPVSAAATDATCPLGAIDFSVAGGGVNPNTAQPWQVGDSYRIAFVSAGTRDATSPDIADYHAFVQSAATAVGWGSTTWRCVGQSYHDPDAKVNSDTQPASGGVVILLPNGVKLVDDNPDLWDSSIDTKWNVTEMAGTYSGSVASGSLRNFGDPGESNIEHGSADRTDNAWWQVYNGAQTAQWHFYAVSDVLTIVSGGADTAPPTPDPANFASGPVADSDTAISMTATTGSDVSGPVAYRFTETSGNPGGTTSAWQASPSYTDTGLSADTTYSYTVTMRDALGNTGTASGAGSATTESGPDLTPPTPDPMTWAVAPAPASQGAEVYESYDYTSGGNLAGNGGTGFGGAWVTTRNNGGAGYFVVNSSGLSFTDGATNLLPVAGNSAYRATANGRSEANRVLSADARSALFADGSTIWFSVLHERSDASEHAGFVMGTGTFDVGSGWELSTYATGGEGFGFGSSNDEWIGAVGYDNATGLSKVDSSTSALSTRLIVGRMVWNADGTNDELNLYDVTDLTTAPTTPIATVSADMDQSMFDRVALLSNKASATYDEVRIGTSFASVTGVNGDSETEIVMTATTASDPSGVEYFFTCTGGPGNDSGWQISPSYTDTGLTPGVEYTYTVTARDKSVAGNTTAASAPASATTAGTPSVGTVPGVVGLNQSAADAAIVGAGFVVGTVSSVYSATVAIGDVISQDPTGGTSTNLGASVDLVVSLGEEPDTDPPTPNPATFAVAPAVDSDTAISMTATIGSDASWPVAYLFTETTGNPGGTSSEWQSSATYTDTGLSPETTYTYTVTMRDSVGNTGTVSMVAGATTDVSDWGTIPFTETFDALAPGDLDGQRGWDTETAVVQSNVTYAGSALAAEVTDGSVQHRFNGEVTRVWSDMRLQVTYMQETPVPDSESTVALYVAGDHHVMVFDGKHATSTGRTVSEGEWVRITTLSDYTAQRWWLFIDGLFVGEYGFYGETATGFSAFAVVGGPSRLDDLLVTQSDIFSIYASGGSFTPLSWVKAYDGNPDVADEDGDGLTLDEEFMLETDPTRSNRFEIVAVGFTPAPTHAPYLQYKANGPPNGALVVSNRTDFASGQDGALSGTVSMVSSNRVQWTGSDPAGPGGFMRIHVSEETP